MRSCAPPHPIPVGHPRLGTLVWHPRLSPHLDTPVSLLVCQLGQPSWAPSSLGKPVGQLWAAQLGTPTWQLDSPVGDPLLGSQLVASGIVTWAGHPWLGAPSGAPQLGTPIGDLGWAPQLGTTCARTRGQDVVAVTCCNVLRLNSTGYLLITGLEKQVVQRAKDNVSDRASELCRKMASMMAFSSTSADLRELLSFRFNRTPPPLGGTKVWHTGQAVPCLQAFELSRHCCRKPPRR